MIGFYLLSLIPVIIGGILWILNKKVILAEWLFGTAAAFLLSGAFHLISISGMSSDEEILSGQITNARQFSAWQEYYQEAIYKYVTKYRTVTYTDSNGKTKSRRESYQERVFSHWEDRKRWHQESWTAYSNINTYYSINKDFFLRLEKEFNYTYKVNGDRKTGERNSRMIGGDPFDYITENKTGFIEPINKIQTFENKVKAAPSVFSFVKVPPNIPVFDWPRPSNVWQTNRVLGTATKKISNRQWDELNAVLGPKHKINLILIGFNSDDPSLLQYQEAKFVGGRKNDLVIAYTETNNKINNVKVFGWTESDLCKKNIESFIIENGINKDQFFDFLKQEIAANYKLKDWKKFDYLTVEPSPKYYYWFLGILFITQTLLYLFFHTNIADKSKKGDYKSIQGILNS